MDFKDFSDFKKYIEAHSLRPLTQGKSGAEVFLLDDHTIAKYSVKAELLEKQNGNTVWNSCCREAVFYSECMKACTGMKAPGSFLPFLPQIFYCSYDAETVQILMREYKPLDKKGLDEGDFEAVMKLLSQVHGMFVPEFLKKEKTAPLQLTDAEIQDCLAGWKFVFNEAKTESEDEYEILDYSKILEIAGSINLLNQTFFSSRLCVCHGDFHAENILSDNSQNTDKNAPKSRRLLLCDWQSVRLGHPAEDLAFFMSRLQGDGINFDENKLISTYCTHAAGGITEKEIKLQLSLANVNTSFRFWHYYLHGSPVNVIKNITGKMYSDFEALKTAI